MFPGSQKDNAQQPLLLNEARLKGKVVEKGSAGDDFYKEQRVQKMRTSIINKTRFVILYILIPSTLSLGVFAGMLYVEWILLNSAEVVNLHLHLLGGARHTIKVVFNLLYEMLATRINPMIVDGEFLDFWEFLVFFGF